MTRLRNLNRTYTRGRVLGTPHTGVTGANIPSAGTNGAGYVYNDLALPGDAAKEICGRITTWPSTGVLRAYEDTSFIYTPVGDGAQSFQYQLYVDGVAIGSPQSVTLNIGSGSATALGATLSGTSSIIAGLASGNSAVDGIAFGATLTGDGIIIAGAAIGQASGVAPGCNLVGVSIIIGGIASSTQFMRAPRGGGYSPQRTVEQERPAAIQRNIR